MAKMVEEFCSRLKRGPAILFLGQDYLRLESGVDPFLSEILRKYGKVTEPDTQYDLILESDAKNSPEASLAWMQKLCDRFSIPPWLSTVGEFAWSAVFTSAIDLIWVKAFRSDWRELQPIFEEKYKPHNPRSRQVLNCNFLYGRVDRVDESEHPPLTKLEFLRRKQIAVSLARRLPETVTALGVLVIEGYGLLDWLKLEEFIPIIDTLGRGQVFVFSATEGFLRNDFISGFIRDGRLTAYSDSLASFLVKGSELGLIHLGERYNEEVYSRQITIKDRILTVPLAIWNQVSKSAQVLNDAVFAASHRLSEEKRYYEFRNFLSESSVKPIWSGYERGFPFEREFEAALLLEVDRRLDSGQLQTEPIILHGQTGMGKTIALGSLAYKVRKKSKYPVLFIERRTDLPHIADLDSFCKWAEDSGAAMVLIVWDGMLDGEQYYNFLQYLVSRGRKVVLVGSSYRYDKARKRNYIEAPAVLSEQEFVNLMTFLNSFEPTLGEIFKKRINPADGTFLVALYRLLPPTRSGIRAGVLQEMDDAQQKIEARAKEGLPLPTQTALAYALWKAKVIDDSQFFSSATKEIAGEILSGPEELVGLVMAPGQFGLRVPLELVLRVLGREIYLNFTNLISGIDVLRWFEDLQGNISLGPRHPLEAKLIVQGRFGGAKIEIGLAQRLLAEIKDTGSPDDVEVQFAVELVRNMGPNMPAASYYAQFFKNLTETLAELRERRGIENPRLMLQEATLLRESIRFGDQDFGQNEEALDKAEKVARYAVEWLRNDPNKKLVSATMVELGAILGSKVHQSLKNFEPVRIAHQIFSKARDVLFKARSLDPENFYVVDVLSWATRDLLKSGLLDEKQRAEMEADIIHIFSSVEAEDFSVVHRERLEQRRLEIGDLIGKDDISAAAFDYLRSVGSGAGYYLRASNMVGRLPFDRLLTAHEIQCCLKAFNYLNEKWKEISKDGRCLQLLLRTWWMGKTGKPIFFGERQTLSFTKADWEYCLRVFIELFGLEESFRSPSLKFIFGLAQFHTNNLEGAFRVFSELARETDYVVGRRRIIRSFLASNPAGEAMVFNGTVTWIGSGKNRGEILVEELRRPIVFIPSDFGRPEIQRNEALSNFHVAFNFIGPIADPIVFQKF
jgi:hypothetical protein